MAEEQSKGIQQIEGCEVIYDMGSGLVIAKVPLDKVKAVSYTHLTLPTIA